MRFLLSSEDFIVPPFAKKRFVMKEVGSNDAPRTQEGQHSRRPSTASVLDDKSSRSDSLSKRKSSDIHHGKSHSFERKRSCNDLTLSASSPVDTYRNPTCDCDLVVIGIANGLEAAQRIGNVSLQLLSRLTYALYNRLSRKQFLADSV